MGCRALTEDELVQKINETGLVFRELSPSETREMIEQINLRKLKAKIGREKKRNKK